MRLPHEFLGFGRVDAAAIKDRAGKDKGRWTRRYGILPDAGGEVYKGEKIV